MSTTAEQVFIQAMSLADEMTDVINIVNASDTASYKARTPGILTLLQAELLSQGEVYATFEYSHRPYIPLGGANSGFAYQTYAGIDQAFEWEGAAYAYSFDVDGEATVYIEDSVDGSTWTTTATVNVADPTYRSYVNTKGVVVPTVGAVKSRIRFSGDYEYSFVNFALFGIPIKAARVPAYAPWVKVTVPADFKSLDQVVNEYAPKQYNRDSFYKWENHRDLYVAWDYEGTIRINYRPIPAVVSAMTDELQLDDVTCRTLLPYALCADLFKEENEQISAYCLRRYRELKAVATKVKPAAEQQMVDVYGGL